MTPTQVGEDGGKEALPRTQFKSCGLGSIWRSYLSSEVQRTMEKRP